MDMLELSRPMHLNLELPDCDLIRGGKKEGDHSAIISTLADRLPKLTGKTGIIFSSKSVLKRYFFDLVKVMPEDTLMLGEDLTGGTGKMRDRYLTGDQASKIVFLSARNLRSFTPEIPSFDRIFLQSLPFNPPGHPVHQSRSALFENAFEGYALPKVRQSLLEILKYLSSGGQKEFIILDRRVQEQNYGEDILNVLKQL
jgi:hypothetical protein